MKSINKNAEAEKLYWNALAIDENHIDAHLNLGVLLQERGRYGDAENELKKVLVLDPSHRNANLLLANLYFEMWKFDEAVEVFRKELVLNPENDALLLNLAMCLEGANKLDESEDILKTLLVKEQNNADIFFCLANVIKKRGRYEEAIEMYKKAISINASHADSYNNLGTSYFELKQFDAAQSCYDKANSLGNENSPSSNWNNAMLQILKGNYIEGWKLYEARLFRKDSKDNYLSFPDKQNWRGHESITGKKIFIQHEQGIGDVIQFCRYLPKLEALGAEVSFSVPKTLFSLMGSLSESIKMVTRIEEIPDVDFYCPLISLPYAFKTQVGTIPSKTPYLFADETKVANWKKTLGQKKIFRIGLAWSGSGTHGNDTKRSMYLECLLPLLDLPVERHSLQIEYRERDKDVLASHPEILQHQEVLSDFSDTAALIETLDLVISVDTAVAHAAGALGKEVWILLPFIPDYRWFMSREDSPWYPTARLFRQKSNSEGWCNVVESMKAILVEKVNMIDNEAQAG